MNNTHNGPTSPDELAAMLINPFYAIEFDPRLIERHEPLTSEDQWVAANRRLLHELGEEAYLRRLLAVLKGDFPTSPE
ncbi:MAG: hypothetical protein ACR2GH_15405 [Pseudonocardia sp.]